MVKLIPLERDSLYITTSALVGNGHLHWALIQVDEYERCTKHHWAPVTSDSSGREAYIRRCLVNGALSATGDTQSIRAYFKISEYTPIRSEDFHAICTPVFPKSDHTAAQNRADGISCRTWVLGLLARLLSQERVAQIEMMVNHHSTQCAKQVATGLLHGTTHLTIVMAI